MRFSRRRRKNSEEIITDNEPLKLSKIDREERKAKWDVSDLMKSNCLKIEREKFTGCDSFFCFFPLRKQAKNQGNQLKLFYFHIKDTIKWISPTKSFKNRKDLKMMLYSGGFSINGELVVWNKSGEINKIVDLKV